MESKKCTKCGEEKELDKFYKNPDLKDGRASWCRECTKTACVANQRKIYKERREALATLGELEAKLQEAQARIAELEAQIRIVKPSFWGRFFGA